jgi:hypothetical protein
MSFRAMNFKTTYILIIIVLVLVGVFFWAVWSGPGSQGGTWVLPSMHDKANPMDPNDVERVEIQRTKPTEETLVFEKDPESKQWRITAPRDYRGNGVAIDDLVRQIHNASREKEAERLTNLSQYGLEPPNEVITLQKGDRQVRLNVGDVSPGPENAENTVIYVTSSDQPKEIMAVKRRSLDKVLKGLNDFRSRDLLSPASSDIQAFTLTQRDKDKVTRGPIELKKGAEDHWSYVQPPYGDAEDRGPNPPGEEKAPGNVETALSDLAALKVESEKDFVEDDAKDLAKYNLDPAKDDIARIEIDRVEEIAKSAAGEKEKKTAKVALVIGVGKKVGENNSQYYAYLDDPKHKDVVRIPVKSVVRLLKLLEKPDALRDRNLVTLGGFKKPDAIDVKNSWGLLEFRHTSDMQKPWQLWRGDKSYAVDEPSIQNLITTLTGPDQVESFPDPAMKAQLGLDKPQAVVQVWADSLPAEDKKKDDKKDDKKEEKKDKKPEPKDKNKPAYTLSFGDRKENSVAVERKRGDEKNGTIVMVPAKVLDQVREGPLAYLDKQLPPFNTNRFDATPNVTKLELTRDGTTYEISREDKAGAPWKIDKPADFAGRTADRATIEEILRALNDLRAVKIEDDKIPADAKLAEWGLKNPRYKAVVTMTKEGKPKTFTYDFGKEADDKTGVYLRSSQQDMIVLVAKNVVDTLQRELQDPTVFQFDPAKVKEVKLTGWIALQKQLGKNEPLTLTIKRAANGSDWEVEPKGSFQLDSKRLDDFLRQLSTLKATKFVAHKATPAADQELDPAKGALVVEITVPGEKEPKKLTLTVGKADGDAAYFAISNQLPGDIFDVRKDLFEKAKTAPAYFSGQ